MNTKQNISPQLLTIREKKQFLKKSSFVHKLRQ